MNLLFWPERPVDFNEREGDGKRNSLLGWPYHILVQSSNNRVKLMVWSLLNGDEVRTLCNATRATKNVFSMS